MARHSAAEPAPSSWRRAEPAARSAAPHTAVPAPHPRENRAVRAAPTARPSPWRAAARCVGSVLLLAVVAVAVAVAVVPAAVGGTALTVLSPSMTPTYPVGSLVVIRPRPVEEIRIGDVVSFASRDPATGAPRTVTHRVVGVDPGPSFRTRGDANADPDPAPVAAADVRGVVWYSLPQVGAWGSALRTGPGLLVAAGAALLLIALLFLVPRRR